MRRHLIIIGTSICLLASCLSAETPGDCQEAAANAKLLQEARERIVWYDDAQTDPMLIPEEVFGMLPYEDLPIPEDDRQAIRMWLSLRRDWLSRFGERYPECSYPELYYRSEVPAEEQKSLEELVAAGPVSLLVKIDRTTDVYWPNQGIYQYNEVSKLEILAGSDYPHQDPLSTRAFLSEGGDIVVDGTRLCTLSPWHDSRPRSKETFLVIGAPDGKGVFRATFYFRVEDGKVVLPKYSVLKSAKECVPIPRHK